MGRVVVKLVCCGKKTAENEDPVLTLIVDGLKRVIHEGDKSYSFMCKECFILSEKTSKNRRDYFNTVVQISGGRKTVLVSVKGKCTLKVNESKCDE